MTTLKHNGQHVFRTGQRLAQNFKPIKPKKEEEVRNAEKQIINTLAAGILARDKEAQDQKRQLAASHPDPPPACLLAPTETAKEVDDWYAKPETIKKNAGGIQGLESYAPPPVLLAPVKEAN